MTTSMNKRTHFFIKNISLTLYSRKGWCWLCVRGELETRTDCYILTQSSSDHSSTSSSSWQGLLNRGSLRAASPQSASWFSRWHLVPQLTPTPTGTDPSFLWHLVIWMSHIHLLPLFLRLFTQVHLLIDGSIEGQYITCVPIEKMC